MASLPPLRPIQNNTPADAVDVQWNFDTLVTHIANELINRDGSVAMSGPFAVPPAVSGGQAATLSQVQAAVPVGTVITFAGSATPSGWAYCNGAVKSQTDPTYAALFAVIGSTYNTGSEGPGNFRLPDFRGKMPLGIGGTSAKTLGQSGGTKDAIVVSHKHTMGVHKHTMGTHSHTWSGTTSSNGSHSHTTNPASTTSDTGTAHDHGLAVGRGFLWFDSGSPTTRLQTTGSGGFPTSLDYTESAGDNHTHNTNIASTTSSTANDHNHTVSGTTGTTDPGDTSSVDPGDTSTVGSSGTNANMPPYLALRYLIRLGES